MFIAQNAAKETDVGRQLIMKGSAMSAMTDQIKGVDASLEGISGCGKSYILSQLREALHDVPVTIIEEVEDREGAALDQGIVALLRKHGDRYFRSGHPRTETLLLLALKAYDAEVEIMPALAAGHFVLEDRSIDTVAIYQALILAPSEPQKQLETANMLYQFACQWRQPPQVTFLIEDDFTTCLERAQRRSANLYSAEETALLHAAANLYDRYAAQEHHRERIVRLDRQQMDFEEIVRVIQTTLVTWQTRGE
ncbi:hypothetical protein ccbrp13_21030 [Ktedonobacteria bacterium brp13]|nr:hypothetical protein ccbrp13_21030 [Ktedonobacteria bacterium brp13]